MALLDLNPASSRLFERAPGPLDHLDPFDRRRFVDFGWGPVAEPTERLLHTAFAAQVRTRPDAIAVEHGGERLTYRQLGRLASVVAADLRKRGIGRGDLVGLFAERSPLLVAAMLGVLQTGAAYVPQHAGVAPGQQLRYIVERTDAPVVLTLSHLRQHLPSFEGVDVVDLDRLVDADDLDHLVEADDVDGLDLDTGRDPNTNRDPDTDAGVVGTPEASVTTLNSPDDPCFVLFTSGTTGPPNGVVVTHRNVANVVLTEPGSLGIEPGMRVGQILSVAFDMAEWEIYGALCHGATLVIRDRDIAQTAATVDVLIATPSILASIDAELCRDSVRVVAVAGEPCPTALAARWASFARFHNSCGPTETTIVNTVKHYDGLGGLTIGAPTPNNTVYVLDDDLRPLPIGQVGEMWAGGDGVTAGYLGADQRTDELNADRYRDDPFLGGGRKMFRTRDLGRWTENGELEHYGRTDDQVKVRGFRVELDSVSSIVEAQPGCGRAATLKYDDRNLVAFAEPATVDPERARAAVAASLPYYAVPRRVFTMAELPRTDRGKIDKRALRAMAEDAIGHIEIDCGGGSR